MRQLLGCLVFLLGSCALLPNAADLDPEDALVEIERAEQELAAGDLKSALNRLIAVRNIDGLEASVRSRCEEALERSADQLLEGYRTSARSSRDFLELFELELPVRYRALAGVLAAERMIAEERRVSAFKLIKRVDRTLPGHPARALAGDVVGRAGLSLIRDDRRYGLIFRYRSRGVSALEYLVLEYPLDPRCPEAYAELAQHYERTGDLDRAIERHEDLLFYHSLSSEAVLSEAGLPYLRLERLEGDDYDRRELLLARSELGRWLERHSEHELREWVASVALECDRRLTRNDLVLAHYYERIGSPFGTKIHSERALQRAQEAGITDLADAARELLASLPAEEREADEFALPESTFESPSKEGDRP